MIHKLVSGSTNNHVHYIVSRDLRSPIVLTSRMLAWSRPSNKVHPFHSVFRPQPQNCTFWAPDNYYDWPSRTMHTLSLALHRAQRGLVSLVGEYSTIFSTSSAKLLSHSPCPNTPEELNNQFVDRDLTCWCPHNQLLAPLQMQSICPRWPLWRSTQWPQRVPWRMF